MLIIPIQNKPDWSHPPYITLALIIVNLLIFLIYQGNDDDIAERAAAIYQEHNLLTIERDYYFAYLQAQHPDRLVALQDDTADEHLFWAIQYDREFDGYLSTLWQNGTIPQTDVTSQWRDARDQFETERNRISSFAAGLTPAEAKPWTFITSMFLHGGWDHLLGNMVFLFLFGFNLETVLRPHIYFGMYLASGIAADALFIAFSPDSTVPLVGASGAISGLMGMYLALYRLRRIRFFYTVFFYFGEFTAPALWILPLWLGKELYGHFFIDSNTAYWAHIGGLLAGAGLMLLAQRSQREFEAQQHVAAQQDEVAQTLKKIQHATTQLDYNKARSLARWLCEGHRTDFRAWRALFDLHKIQPEQKSFHESTFALLKQFSAEATPFDAWQAQVEDILAEYRQISPKAPALTGNMYLALARKYWAGAARHQAENFVRLAQERRSHARATAQLLGEIKDYYHQRRQNAKAAHWDSLIKQLQATNPPALD